MSELQTAVVIRCGGDGGNCHRQLGVLKVSGPPGGGHLLENQGWPTENGYPLLQAPVPSSFAGSSGILDCPGHTVAVSGDGDWREGDSVELPFSLLRAPYEAFLRTGKVQEIHWLSEDSPHGDLRHF